MPDEVALQLGEFEVVSLVAGNDLRRPFVGKQTQLLQQVNRRWWHGSRLLHDRHRRQHVSSVCLKYRRIFIPS